MSWLSKLMPSGIRTEGGGAKSKRSVPEGLWEKCDRCGAVLYRPELEENLEVCPKCGFHMSIRARARLQALFDPGSIEEISTGLAPVDVLKFRDQKKYADRFKAAQKATDEFQRVFRDRSAPEEVAERKVPRGGSKRLSVLLVEAGLVPSRAEAERLIKQGGVEIDGERTADVKKELDLSKSAGYLLRALIADDALAGYFVAMQGVEEMHLLNITVAPELQGRGHGGWMLDALRVECVVRRLAQLWLEVRLSNERARRLYEHYGFRSVGLRRGYYPARGRTREDAVVMSLAIPEAIHGLG